ncbi:MAG TPA: SDR family NAD(P)-dependent oxidoreductase, partial [Rummeliibacillus sp.]|nr:SDR family NAD(P)-dependent oxidoreductase [Rummeliibacillus sp.]
MRLENKVAVITGGASGIGLAAVKRFAQEGATVIIADFNIEAGKKIESELLDENYPVAFHPINVAEQESVNTVVKKVLDQYGKIDILVNNAGITNDAMISKMTSEQFDQVIDVNLKGVFNCTQAVIPSMVSQGN